MLPKSFQLLHREWHVRLISDDEMKWHVVDNGVKKDNYENPYAGVCDSDAAVIYINREQEYPQLVHTFYHELVHALLYTMGLFDPKSHNEQIVDVYGALLAQVMLTWKGQQPNL